MYIIYIRKKYFKFLEINICLLLHPSVVQSSEQIPDTQEGFVKEHNFIGRSTGRFINCFTVTSIVYKIILKEHELTQSEGGAETAFGLTFGFTTRF